MIYSVGVFEARPDCENPRVENRASDTDGVRDSGILVEEERRELVQ